MQASVSAFINEDTRDIEDTAINLHTLGICERIKYLFESPKVTIGWIQNSEENIQHLTSQEALYDNIFKILVEGRFSFFP